MKHGIPPTAREAADALGISQSATRIRLNNAREDGIVVRRAHGEDGAGRPVWRWYVTEKGKELL